MAQWHFKHCMRGQTLTRTVRDQNELLTSLLSYVEGAEDRIVRFSNLVRSRDCSFQSQVLVKDCLVLRRVTSKLTIQIQIHFLPLLSYIRFQTHTLLLLCQSIHHSTTNVHLPNRSFTSSAAHLLTLKHTFRFRLKLGRWAANQIIAP